MREQYINFLITKLQHHFDVYIISNQFEKQCFHIHDKLLRLYAKYIVPALDNEEMIYLRKVLLRQLINKYGDEFTIEYTFNNNIISVEYIDNHDRNSRTVIYDDNEIV